MVQRSRFWDGTSVGDAVVAPYDAGTEFSEVMTAVAGLTSDPNKGGLLSSISVSMFAPGTLRIGAFEALVYGAWYQNDANVDFVVATPAAATRLDTVVLRKDWAAQTVRMLVISGTEGGTAPPLVQTPGVTWDVPIAGLSTTTGGTTTITPSSSRADFWYRSAPGSIRTDNTVGIGATVQGTNPNQHALFTVGIGSSLLGSAVPGTVNPNFVLSNNTKWVAVGGSTQEQPIVGGFPGSRIQLYNGELTFSFAQGVADGAAQIYHEVFKLAQTGITLGKGAVASGSIVLIAGGNPGQGESRWQVSAAYQSDFTVQDIIRNSAVPFRISRAIGTVSLGPTAGSAALSWALGTLSDWVGGQATYGGQNGGYMMVGRGHDNAGNSVSVAPATHNAIHLGWGDRGYALVHSVSGLVQDSFEEAKEDFAPLDPLACAEAVLDTDWMSYTYKPYAMSQPPDVLPRRAHINNKTYDGEQEKWEALLPEVRRGMVKANLMRRQKGYVLASDRYRVAPLFGMADRRSASAQSDLAVVACALQHALERIAVLEGRAVEVNGFARR